MGRRVAILLGLGAVCLLAVACGSSGPDLGSGPADSVKGIWTGDYTGQDTAPSGHFCVDFEQDDRSLSGNIYFDGGDGQQLQGAISEDRMTFVWGAVAAPTPSTATAIIAGGSASADVDATAGTLSGAFVITTSAAHGTLTGKLTDMQRCGS